LIFFFLRWSGDGEDGSVWGVACALRCSFSLRLEVPWGLGVQFPLEHQVPIGDLPL